MDFQRLSIRTLYKKNEKNGEKTRKSEITGANRLSTFKNLSDYRLFRARSSTFTTSVCVSTFKNFIDFQTSRVRVSTFRGRVCAHAEQAAGKPGLHGPGFSVFGVAGWLPGIGSEAARRRFLRFRRVNVTESHL